jgi:hypothetical protein
MAIKIGFTQHGFERFKERVNSKVREKQATEIIRKIYRTGTRLQNMSREEKSFCYTKMKNYSFVMGRIVKYDDVFYFFAKNGKCITCYPMGERQRTSA